MKGIDLEDIGFDQIPVAGLVKAAVGLVDLARVREREDMSARRSASSRSRGRREEMWAGRIMGAGSFLFRLSHCMDILDRYAAG